MIYTKEPWEIQNGSTGPYIIAKDGNGKHVTVAQFFSRGIAGCETKGNARLAKAAPKMYEALESLVFYMQQDGVPWSQLKTEVEKAKQALAEVEGEK